MREREQRSTAGAAVAVGVVAAVVAGAVSARLVIDTLTGRDGVAWVLGRASGLASYVLLVTLVVTGLLLAHPWTRRVRRPGPAARLAFHSGLATFTLLFVVLHVVVLATDPWAQVGWRGAVLPMASVYRPVPVTLGVIALWAGLLVGVTARWAGRAVGRVWWPVHKAAAAVLVLVWGHSVLAGTDTPLLRTFYVASGVGVAALAVTRYAARTPTDRVDALADELSREGAALARGPRWTSGAIR